jgi:C1A family cysteine protease
MFMHPKRYWQINRVFFNKGKKEVFSPSRLFIYYTERRMEGTIHEDDGAMIRNGIKSVNKEGA